MRTSSARAQPGKRKSSARYPIDRRNYGELQRLKARQRAATGDRDLYTRAVERARMEQLEVMVDLTSGGFLSKTKRKRAIR